MDAYIVKAYRSAVGKAKKGGFKNYRSDDLAVDIITHLLEQTPELDPKLVDDVIVGCANPEGEQGLQIGRQISMRALGKEVPGVTVLTATVLPAWRPSPLRLPKSAQAWAKFTLPAVPKA